MNKNLIQAQERVGRFRLNEDLEDVLNESMADFEDNPVYDTIMKWIRRFPQYADEIFYYIDCVILCEETEGYE